MVQGLIFQSQFDEQRYLRRPNIKGYSDPIGTTDNFKDAMIAMKINLDPFTEEDITDLVDSMILEDPEVMRHFLDDFMIRRVEMDSEEVAHVMNVYGMRLEYENGRILRATSADELKECKICSQEKAVLVSFPLFEICRGCINLIEKAEGTAE